jgi:hypothetical protein
VVAPLLLPEFFLTTTGNPTGLPSSSSSGPSTPLTAMLREAGKHLSAPCAELPDQFFVHGTLLLQHLRGHAEGDGLLRLRVRDEAAVQNVTRAVGARECRRDHAGGAGFGGDDRQAGALQRLQDRLRALAERGTDGQRRFSG